ncbi:hypothetical protein NDU88_002206 [Pleurodeles waltl]|uniref:Uncharacterized protein n=1 Tax=Pleurodeles waltl TaxID=8319 RepID=A0AAV7M1Q6_PLEWA|nr:hypothetical protein NDU88_002206 [Pleurodeles waltl]
MAHSIEKVAMEEGARTRLLDHVVVKEKKDTATSLTSELRALEILGIFEEYLELRINPRKLVIYPIPKCPMDMQWANGLDIQADGFKYLG